MKQSLALLLAFSVCLAFAPVAWAAAGPVESLTPAEDLLSGETGEARADIPATEHGEDGHAKKAGLPQFDPSSFTSQIFWLVSAFAVLYGFFSKKTLPDIAHILQRRQEQIGQDIATAQALREKAEQAKNRYERAVTEAQQTSTALFLKAEAEVKAKTAAALEEFKNRSALRLKDTEDFIEKTKKESMDGVHSVAAEIASLAAEKIVGIPADINQAKAVIHNLNKKAA